MYAKSCAEVALDLQGGLEEAGVDMQEANRITTEAYDSCVAAGGAAEG